MIEIRQVGFHVDYIQFHVRIRRFDIRKFWWQRWGMARYEKKRAKEVAEYTRVAREFIGPPTPPIVIDDWQEFLRRQRAGVYST